MHNKSWKSQSSVALVVTPNALAALNEDLRINGARKFIREMLVTVPLDSNKPERLGSKYYYTRVVDLFIPSIEANGTGFR